jgi:hypothetical protein
MRFADILPVRAAMDDPAYVRLIDRARDGDMLAIGRLVHDRRTRAVLTCQQVRRFAASVTPSQLLEEMRDTDLPWRPPHAPQPDR